MYELGMAHTLGKETVLIYQKGEAPKFPFDLAHIRRIEYKNDAIGGKKLEDQLRETITNILTPKILA
jgi:predicted nucleotide-binding protein